jgi:hypothetical protein
VGFFCELFHGRGAWGRQGGPPGGVHL